MMCNLKWALYLCLCVHSADSAAAIRTVAYTGEYGLGLPDGIQVSHLGGGFHMPVINAGGQIAFHSTLGGTEYGEAVWLDDHGHLKTVARTGDAASDGGKFIDFAYVQVTATGYAAFQASTRLAEGSHRSGGMFASDGNSVQILAHSLADVPGTPGGTKYQAFNGPPLYSPSAMAFQAEVGGPKYGGAGIWILSDCMPTLVTRIGMPVPGGEPGQEFQSIRLPILNSTGDISFTASVGPSPFQMSELEGIWTMRGDKLELLARNDEPAPGTHLGIHGGFREFYLSPSGKLVFFDASGIWEKLEGETRLIAGAANSFTELNDRTRFHFINGLQASSGGHVTFTAEYVSIPDDPTSGFGVWIEDVQGLRSIALAGEHPPGTSEGSRFDAMGYPSISSAGQVAFHGYFSDIENGNGIFATDRFGNLQLIAKIGDVLEVAPGDFRTVETASFQNYTGNDDGRPSGFNDRGQLVFWAQFTDGSEGIFVSDAVAVTEPGSLLAAAMILALAAFSRSRFGSIWPRRPAML